jgi:peroxiredoxin
MKSSPLVRKGNGKIAALLMIAGVVLLLVNVLLAQQNKKLRFLASRPDRSLEVRVGTALPSLEGVDDDGHRQRISYGLDTRKTVLLIFSPNCSACGENLPNWEVIIRGIDRQSFRLYAISLQSQGVKEYASQHGINEITLLTEIDAKYRVAYNLALTPQIILTDSDGKVEKVWTGLLQEEDKRDVERALNVQLP